MNHRAVLGLVLGFLVFVLSAADGRCEDDTGYTTSCLKHKDFCHNDNVRWPDESVLYTKCKKTCGRCNESSVKASNKSEEIYNSIDGGKSCGDEYKSCGNYDQAYCESATWGDGTVFWKYCRKTCNKCSNESDKSDKTDNFRGSDSSCVDKNPNCGDYDQPYCQNGAWDNGQTVFWVSMMFSKSY